MHLNSERYGEYLVRGESEKNNCLFKNKLKEKLAQARQ